MRVTGVVLLLFWGQTLCSPLVVKMDQNDVFKFSPELNLKLKSQPIFKSSKEEATCGYKSCDLGKSDMINVHLVPHTHDDVGWLKTVDQYFYGSRNDIQHAGVQYILDTVVEALEKDPRRRFIYVEIAFFERWWNELHDSTRHVVKKLVNEGRLEFILGGWCMNDEASTHYNAIIDQHALGFKFLKENFGECGRPKIGWQIDPFGHSREQASLFAQFGFDGLFFGRLDYQDKNKRLKDKTMEEMWFASESLTLDQAGLFTGVNYNGYGPPSGFCFDRGCADPPMMDDERLEDYNVPQRVSDFIKAVNDQAKHFSTNHIMMTMGSDFQFENAHQNFKNLDKLIKYVNEEQFKNNSKINLIYSTPSCYLYALNQINQTYSTKADDFFPYASEPHTFWTGYFTSRPALKGYVRQTNNFLQVCKQLNVFAKHPTSLQPDERLRVLMEAMGVAQHHDAVSGTEKQHVAYDYARRLARGVLACQDVIQDAYAELLPISKGINAPDQLFCPLANVSYCPPLENLSSFTIVAYNPIGRSGLYNIRVPISNNAFTVTDSKGKTIISQIVNITSATKNIPEYNGSKSSAELVFQASLPPLGFATFFVTKSSESKNLKDHSPSDDPAIENEFTRLTFDTTTGLLKSMTNKEKSLSINLSQQLLFYKGFKGNNTKPEFRASGAYIFRSNGSQAEAIADKVAVEVVKGSVVQEVRQVFGSWASQVIRLYAGKKEAEVEWTVGPIPFMDGIGKEIISRYTTDIESKSTFYTDSNGREMLKRVRDFRPTWELNQTEPVAGNYYPVNSRIFIRDEASSKAQLTIMTDRSEGGSSLRDGEIELMVHRRLLVDDAFGAGEALNETGISGKGLVVRGTHYLLLDSVADSSQRHRDLGERLFMAPQITFSKNSLTSDEYAKLYHSLWSALTSELPDNVHLLTLEPQGNGLYIVRLENFYAEGEDSELSKPVTVDLAMLFKDKKVSKIEEMTLGGNQLLKEAQRLQWNISGKGRTNGRMQDFVTPVSESNGSYKVELKPMQIRTFEVALE